MQQFREPLLQSVRLLSAGPYGRQAFQMDVCDGATRTHGCVRLERRLVGRFDFPGRACQRGGSVALVQSFPARLGSNGSHVIVQMRLRRECRLRVCPGDFQRLCGSDGRPFAFGYDPTKLPSTTVFT